MITPTVLAVEITSSEILAAILTFAGLLLGSSVLSSYITARSMKKKIASDVHKTDTETMLNLSEKFVDLVKEFDKAKRESISAEERHSLERIASNEKLSDLTEKVEKCDQEHVEWAAKENEWSRCKTDVLQFLIYAEAELKTMTSQPTLLEAVNSLKTQFEAT